MAENREDKEINLLELITVLWESKSSIIGITLLSTFLATGYALMLPNIYQSSALLSPAEGFENNITGLWVSTPV